jgi:hypothetical protein
VDLDKIPLRLSFDIQDLNKAVERLNRNKGFKSLRADIKAIGSFTPTAYGASIINNQIKILHQRMIEQDRDKMRGIVPAQGPSADKIIENLRSFEFERWRRSRELGASLHRNFLLSTQNGLVTHAQYAHYF